MLVTKAKLTSYKRHKTQINLTFSVPLETDELQLEQNIKTSGFLAFNPDQFKKKVEDFMRNKSVGIDRDGFSQSQLLRGDIMTIWEDAVAAKKTEKTVDQFYVDTMEWIRNKVITELL